VRLETPEEIRTLQRKLYIKAKGEPAFRFYALYDKVYRDDILRHAYHLAKANKGSAGTDGVTFEDIERGEGEEAFLAGLKEELKGRTYRAGPVRRVMIPKPGGGERPLGIPNIRDRVVQTAVKLVVEPIFEADFCGNSYGFRPRRSAHDAVNDVNRAMHRGYTEVIDADLSKYFDSIPHAKLMTVVARRIVDGGILHLIKMWLKAPVVSVGEDGKKQVSGGKGNRRGTPQGGVISPLLSNLYLHLMDKAWEKRDMEGRYGARIVRYADDFVVLCREGVRLPLAEVKRILERLGLTLNREKTRVVDTWKDSFDFLGFKMCMKRSARTGRGYASTEPSRKSMRKIKAAVTSQTRHQRMMVPMGDIVNDVNKVLRGWVGYFHLHNCHLAFKGLRRHVEMRMQIHLKRRHRIKGWQMTYQLFPTNSLYDRFGLYKVPTTAGWTAAHALM
jgi:group II intron reverse transcriptase/maturase